MHGKGLVGIAMKLSVSNYNLLNFNNDHIVISRHGVSRVNSAPLLDVIRGLNNRSNITEDELYALITEHNLDRREAYESLTKIVGLKKESAIPFFEKTIVAHDWDDPDEIESLLLSELDSSTTVCRISDLDMHLHRDRQSLIVMAFSQYDYHRLKELYFEITSESPNSAIIVCYSNEENYIIGQPYLSVIGNPCHFCSIDRLADHETYKSSRNAWSKLLDFCRHKHIPVPSPSRNLYQRSLIVGAIAQKIKLMTGNADNYRFQDNILQETRLSLSNGQVSESSISHWCMCDCLKARR